jgi:hypothetical protein
MKAAQQQLLAPLAWAGIYGSVQETVRGPDFTRVGPCRCQQPVAVVAVEMWEPAFGAGFQARWTDNKSWAEIPPSVPPSVISTANTQFCPFWCKCRRWGLRKTKIRVSRKPRRMHTFTDCCAEPNLHSSRMLVVSRKRCRRETESSENPQRDVGVSPNGIVPYGKGRNPDSLACSNRGKYLFRGVKKIKIRWSRVKS